MTLDSASSASDASSGESDRHEGAIADRRDWRDGVVTQIPSLRAFAWSLARNAHDADDLVQETLTKAWTYRARYEAGTNLRAWLFTILRNTWYSAIQKRSREVADEEGRHAAAMTSEPAQEWSAELTSLQDALNRLPPEHREAIVMVGAAGLSYEEAAEISGVALGTIKSRVNRARNRLAEELDFDRSSPGDAA